jgi:hypothetical protein
MLKREFLTNNLKQFENNEYFRNLFIKIKKRFWTLAICNIGKNLEETIFIKKKFNFFFIKKKKKENNCWNLFANFFKTKKTVFLVRKKSWFFNLKKKNVIFAKRLFFRRFKKETK